MMLNWTLVIWHQSLQGGALEGYGDWVDSVAFSPDGKQVVSFPE